MTAPSHTDTAMSVDEILDDGSAGLRYFETYLPRAVKLEPAITETYSKICALYDQERGLDLDALAGDGDRIAQSASALDVELKAQQAFAARLKSSWSGAASDQAAWQLARVQDRATSVTKSLHDIAQAHGAAATLVRSVVSDKSKLVATFDVPTIGGMTIDEIDALIAGSTDQLSTFSSGLVEKLAKALPNLGIVPGLPVGALYRARLANECSVWLKTVFLPDVKSKLAAFTQLCDATEVAVRRGLQVVAKLMEALDDSAFRAPPGGTATPGTEPTTSSPGSTSTSPASYGSPGAGSTSSGPAQTGSAAYVPPSSTSPTASTPTASQPPTALPPTTATGWVAPTVPGTTAKTDQGQGVDGAASSPTKALTDGLVQAITGVVKSVADAAQALVQSAVDEFGVADQQGGAPASDTAASDTAASDTPATAVPPAVTPSPPTPSPPPPLAVSEPASPDSPVPATGPPLPDRGHIEAEFNGFGARLSLHADGAVELTTTAPGLPPLPSASADAGPVDGAIEPPHAAVPDAPDVSAPAAAQTDVVAAPAVPIEPEPSLPPEPPHAPESVPPEVPAGLRTDGDGSDNNGGQVPPVVDAQLAEAGPL